jgi:hypothetical protein
MTEELDQMPAPPRPPRRMLQPRKDALREELKHALAVADLYRADAAMLRAENDRLRAPWYRRLFATHPARPRGGA